MAEKSDRPVLWLVRQGKGLVPYSQFDQEYLERYKIESHVTCTIEQPRDAATVRKIHGLIGLVANGMGEDPKSLKVIMMMRCGSIRTVDHIKGLGTTIAPERIRDMEQPDLEDLWKRLVELVLLDYLPFIQRDDLAAEVERYVGIQHEMDPSPIRYR